MRLVSTTSQGFVPPTRKVLILRTKPPGWCHVNVLFSEQQRYSVEYLKKLCMVQRRRQIQAIVKSFRMPFGQVAKPSPQGKLQRSCIKQVIHTLLALEQRQAL